MSPLYILRNKFRQWRDNCHFGNDQNTNATVMEKGKNGLEMPLHHLKKKSRAVIKHIDTHDRHQLQKILAMGVLPNRQVYVIQTYPVMVIQIDETQLALDNDLARCIIVSEY